MNMSPALAAFVQNREPSFDHKVKTLVGKFWDAAPNSAEAYEAADTLATMVARHVENSEPPAFKRLEELLGCKLR